MNPYLAELYGTAENIGASGGADVEKIAQAAILNETLANEGIALESLSPVDRVKVAAEIFGMDSPLVKAAMEEMESEEEEEEEEGSEKEKEAAEKLAEYDFYGRAMAHAYVNELATIEKQAGLRNIASTVKRGLGRARKGVENLGEKVTGTVLRTGGAERMLNPKTKRLIGAGTLGVGAGIGAAGASHLMGKKKESALDILAQARAEEMLKEAGVSSDHEKLASAVEARAVEMLREAGYQFE